MIFSVTVKILFTDTGLLSAEGMPGANGSPGIPEAKGQSGLQGPIGFPGSRVVKGDDGKKNTRRIERKV